MAEILKGAPVAAAITEGCAKRSEALKERGIVPMLAIVRIGEKSSDLAYERGAVKRCAMTGIEVKNIALPETVTQTEMLRVIDEINADAAVHGCLMLRPFPKTLNETELCERLIGQKDVDCQTRSSLATVFTGHGEGYAPCTAQACLEILDYYGVKPEGKNVAVIGRSLVIGRPVALMLQKQNATVTMCHSKTVNMAAICRNAEILVAAAGKAGVVTPDFTSPEQVIIDVGINLNEEGNLCGDVDFEKVCPMVKAITPVPGGVGSVTTAVLCKHVIEAAERISE